MSSLVERLTTSLYGEKIDSPSWKNNILYYENMIKSFPWVNTVSVSRDISTQVDATSYKQEKNLW